MSHFLLITPITQRVFSDTMHNMLGVTTEFMMSFDLDFDTL